MLLLPLLFRVLFRDLAGLVIVSFKLFLRLPEMVRTRKLIMRATMSRHCLFQHPLKLTLSLHRASLKHLTCQRLHRPYHHSHQTYHDQYLWNILLDPKGLLVITITIDAKDVASLLWLPCSSLIGSRRKYLCLLWCQSIHCTFTIAFTGGQHSYSY